MTGNAMAVKWQLYGKDLKSIWTYLELYGKYLDISGSSKI